MCDSAQIPVAPGSGIAAPGVGDGLRLVSGRALSVPQPVVAIDHRGVQISSVKHADDGSGELIVRLYEACGDRATTTVRTARPIAGAVRCNLLEEPSDGIECGDGIVLLTLRPFELVTLRLLIS